MTALLPGDPERIGEYTTLGRLGNGAMGRVFLARSPGGRRVAVKVIRAELADDDGFRERFSREVAAMRAVGGFWTAAVVDADPDAPVPWLATEYVSGPTLQAAVAADGPLSVPRARALAAGLAEALRAVHETGLIHRDLKPANVLLTEDGPRVIDFGIARTLDGTGLTATGMVVGTPSFLSPEQIEGRAVTTASDLFALGSVLVFATTGDGPFGSGTLPALVYRVVHGEPNLAGVPDELRPLVARCLDRDPAARPTPTDVLTELTATVDWAPRATGPVHEPTMAHTRVATSVAEHRPAPPAPAPPAPPVDASVSRFRVRGRAGAAFSFVLLAPCALVLLGMAADAFVRDRDESAAVLVLLGLPFAYWATRELWRLAGPHRWLEVSKAGLTLGRGSRSRHLPWSEVARVRVVDDRKRPWMVVTVNAGVSRAGLGADTNSGLRAYPVAHTLSRRARDRELQELRAALGWYGRASYDPSP